MFARIPNTIPEWALAVAGVIAFGIFALGRQNFFVRPQSLTRRQHLFQFATLVLAVTHVLALFVLEPAGETWAGIGVGIYALALSLFLSAIEAAGRVPMTRAFVYEPRCNHIIRQGPYRVIRHPIYLSYSLAWLAAPVATHHPVLAITAVMMVACYAMSAREEERRMTLGSLKEEYADWQKRTWRMIPFLY